MALAGCRLGFCHGNNVSGGVAGVCRHMTRAVDGMPLPTHRRPCARQRAGSSWLKHHVYMSTSMAPLHCDKQALASVTVHAVTVAR